VVFKKGYKCQFRYERLCSWSKVGHCWWYVLR